MVITSNIDKISEKIQLFYKTHHKTITGMLVRTPNISKMRMENDPF